MESKLAFSAFTDEEVISLILNEGRPSLFEIIYNRYHGKVLNKCYTLLKQKELSAEFAIDIMAKAFEKLDSFKGHSSFSTWLYSITYNFCIDYLREKKKLHYPEWNSNQELPDISDNVIDETAEEVSYERIIELMEKLHAEEKALLLMKYQDDMSLKQISESLRITESAVKMRLKRAKNRLLFLYKHAKTNC